VSSPIILAYGGVANCSAAYADSKFWSKHQLNALLVWQAYYLHRYSIGLEHAPFVVSVYFFLI